MTDQTLLDQLHRFDLFRDLAAEDLVAREGLFVRRTYAAGEHILEVAGDGPDVTFLVSGAVRVVTYTITGKELELTQFAAPGYFGELTAIDGTPGAAEVIALEPCACLAMTAADFRAFLLANPPALMHLAQKLARQVRDSNFQIMMNAPL